MFQKKIFILIKTQLNYHTNSNICKHKLFLLLFLEVCVQTKQKQENDLDLQESVSKKKERKKCPRCYSLFQFCIVF